MVSCGISGAGNAASQCGHTPGTMGQLVRPCSPSSVTLPGRVGWVAAVTAEDVGKDHACRRRRGGPIESSGACVRVITAHAYTSRILEGFSYPCSVRHSPTSISHLYMSLQKSSGLTPQHPWPSLTRQACVCSYYACFSAVGTTSGARYRPNGNRRID